MASHTYADRTAMARELEILDEVDRTKPNRILCAYMACKHNGTSTHFHTHMHH